jgi:hypothetical protein
MQPFLHHILVALLPQACILVASCLSATPLRSTTFPDCTFTSSGIANCKSSTTMPPQRKKAKISVAKQSKQATLDGWLALPPSKKRRVKKRPPLAQLQFPDPNTLDENTIRLQSVDWLSYHQHDYHSRRLWCPFHCGHRCLDGLDGVRRHLQSDGHPMMHHRVFEQMMKEYMTAGIDCAPGFP